MRGCKLIFGYEIQTVQTPVLIGLSKHYMIIDVMAQEKDEEEIVLTCKASSNPSQVILQLHLLSLSLELIKIALRLCDFLKDFL